jgi:phosphoribosylanthranilate isomerase
LDPRFQAHPIRLRKCDRFLEFHGAGVHVAIKFCGLTNEGDAREASRLGADFAGVIFAGGPRHLDEENAARVFNALSPATKRVGVVGTSDPAALGELGRRLSLDVLQLHGDPAPADVLTLRAEWSGEIWAVVRAADIPSEELIRQFFGVADAVLIDSGGRGTRGGTGESFDWPALAARLGARRGSRLVVAGGLSASNVAVAIRRLAPDVVDVATGIESAPGVKDHTKMKAFVAAVRERSGA